MWVYLILANKTPQIKHQFVSLILPITINDLVIMRKDSLLGQNDWLPCRHQITFGL